jgi:hypothetical protein
MNDDPSTTAGAIIKAGMRPLFAIWRANLLT